MGKLIDCELVTGAIFQRFDPNLALLVVNTQHSVQDPLFCGTESLMSISYKHDSLKVG